MKKLLMTAILLSSAAGYTATTGNLLLRGTVPELLAIEVTPEAIAANLPLDTTQTDTKVATVNEKSNSNTGYKVSITSTNAGSLVHETVATSFISYDLSYDGNNVDLANGDEFSFATAASVDTNKDIGITYTGIAHENLIEGDYSDTVTFTISAN